MEGAEGVHMGFRFPRESASHKSCNKRTRLSIPVTLRVLNPRELHFFMMMADPLFTSASDGVAYCVTYPYHT